MFVNRRRCGASHYATIALFHVTNLCCLSTSLFRLWPCGTRDWRRQGLLHVLCRPRNPFDSCHVSKSGRKDEHFCQVSPETYQKVLWYEHHRCIHGKHGNRWILLLCWHALHRGSCLLSLWGLELLPIILLLLHHINNNRLWGLCGPSEEQSPPKEAPLCGL